MTKAEMTARVGAELERIPKWPGEHQAKLRAYYNLARRQSLGRNGAVQQTAGQVLRECIDFIRKENPAAEVRFDQQYFGQQCR